MGLAEASRYLSRYKLGVVGQRVIDFMAVRRLTDVTFCAACEGGEDALEWAGHAQFVSPERLHAERRQWTNQSVGSLAALSLDVLKEIATPAAPIHLLAYSSSSEWEETARASRGTIKFVAIASSLKARLDDKIHVRQHLARLGLPVPKGLALSSDHPDLSLVLKSLGVPLILQRNVGSAGIGTYLVASETELRDLLGETPQSAWLASAYAGSLTLNVHGLVHDLGVLSSVPSIQLTGIPGLCSYPTVYCGNDFEAASYLPKPVTDRVAALTKRVGAWLHSLGYRGLYGIDLSINDLEVTILEVNPRLQGSSWLLGEIEFEHEKVPSTVNHFLVLLGHEVNSADGSIDRAFGSHAVVHSQVNEATPVSCALDPGIYSLGRDGRFLRKRSGIGLLDLSGDEILLFGLPPKSETTIEPGAVIARFASRRRLGGKDGRELSPFGRQVLQEIQKGFTVRAPRRQA